jgi:hypothetical protein
VIEGIKANVPGLGIVVRISAFDTVPYAKRADGIGEPVRMDTRGGPGFCVIEDDDRVDEALGECREVLAMLERLGVRWVCISGGSPYYNPHAQRPAMFPLDGYEPPEDAARRRPADRGHGTVEAGVPAARDRRIGAHTCRSGCRAAAQRGLTVDPSVSAASSCRTRTAGRHARRRAAEAEPVLQDVQRLHDGPRLGLVSGCYPLDKFYTARSATR